MAILVIVGGPGAPGMTTTALGLTLHWPRQALLADCDRDPAQAVPAGYLRGLDLGGRGLASLARLHRETREIAPDLLSQTVTLNQDTEFPRRFLPGFAQPGAVRLFDHIWPELADAFRGLEAQDIDVIVDAGRSGHDGLPSALLEAADLIGFVLRSDLKSLAASRLYLPVLTEQLSTLPVDKPLGLLLVGPNRPYAAREIVTQFGLRCWAKLPWAPHEAAVLSHGDPEPRRFGSSALVAAYKVAAQHLADLIGQDRGTRQELLKGIFHD